MTGPVPAIPATIRMRSAERSDQPAVLALPVAAGLPGDGLDDAWRVWVAESAGRICGAVAVERYESEDAPGGAVLAASLPRRLRDEEASRPD